MLHSQQHCTLCLLVRHSCKWLPTVVRHPPLQLQGCSFCRVGTRCRDAVDTCAVARCLAPTIDQADRWKARGAAYSPAEASAMQGTLLQYGPKAEHLAFASNLSCSKQVVLIGGLTDGLLFAPYAPALASALATRGWSLLQAQLSSSYQGFGTASLDQDAQEVHLLMQHLAAQQGVTQVLLMGHSTGCQDAVRYVQRYGSQDTQQQQGRRLPQLVGVVLQAPVSDSEWLGMYADQLDPLVPEADRLVAAGQGQQILTRLELLDGAPITAQRFLSLYRPRGDDDMFSTHFTDGELAVLFAHMKDVPCLILASGADEAVPPELQNGIGHMAQRLAAAMGPAASATTIPAAPHNCAGHEIQVAEVVQSWLDKLPAGTGV